MLQRFRADNRIYKNHFIYASHNLSDYLDTKLMILTAFLKQSSSEDDHIAFDRWYDYNVAQVGLMGVPTNTAIELLIDQRCHKIKTGSSVSTIYH